MDWRNDDAPSSNSGITETVAMYINPPAVNGKIMLENPKSSPEISNHVGYIRLETPSKIVT